MNLFTSDLFTPAMSEGLASGAPRSYRALTFGRRYGRATAPSADLPSVLLKSCVVDSIGDERVLLDFDMAA